MGHARPAAASRQESLLSTTLENEAIATVEIEATQTDWVGDLCGGLGSDSAAGCGRCAAAAGRAGSGGWAVDGVAGAGLGSATEVRAAGGGDVVRAVGAAGECASLKWPHLEP